MSGSIIASPGRRGVATLLIGVLATLLGVLLLLPPSASAATTVKAQLSLSGIATSDNPTGGSVLGVHPGDTVQFSASTLPTAGLDKLGLGGLVGGLLGGIAKYQVSVDFSGLPGGKAGTVLSGAAAATFSFPKAGKYNFTWSAQSIGLLGAVPINLDGNQLAAAGIKLNAQNQYVGQIVVATNPPKGGISVQLPGVSVSPVLPVVGSLPKISLPGVTTPTIPVTVPDLNPAKSSTAGSAKSTKPGTSKLPAQTAVLPVPAMVVPQGSGQVLGDPGNFQGTALGGTSNPVGESAVSVAPVPGASTSGTGHAKASPAAATANSAGKDKTIDLASNSPSSSGLPAVLALVAVLVLALVAGAYARLFLLRKHP